MYLTAEEMESLDIGQPILTSEKSKNRLYLCWRNSKGAQCKMIGPQTKCFCNHKFKDHQYLHPKGKKAPCLANKCKCKCFDYIPSHGSYDFKCLCKHSFKQHDCINKKCGKVNCLQCSGFASAWTCSCGSKFAQHQTIVQTYQERKAKGKNLNDMERMNDELTNLTQEGSLYRPIKMDPMERVRQKQFNNPYNSANNPFGYSKPPISCKYLQEQQLQQYRLDMKKR